MMLKNESRLRVPRKNCFHQKKSSKKYFNSRENQDLYHPVQYSSEINEFSGRMNLISKGFVRSGFENYKLHTHIKCVRTLSICS